MKKYLAPAIGVAAFVIGGIIARDKTFEAMDTLEKFFSTKPKADK
jgi:hypothetical protein